MCGRFEGDGLRRVLRESDGSMRGKSRIFQNGSRLGLWGGFVGGEC